MGKTSKSSILKTTLKELISDLKVLSIEKGNLLEMTIKNMSPSQLLSDIKNVDSDLCKNIPIQLLQTIPEGVQYLKILGVYQPMFTLQNEIVLQENVPVSNTPPLPPPTTVDNSNPMVNLTNNENLPDSFRELLTPNESNKDIINLATDLFQDLNLQDTLGGSGGEPFDMSNMMGLFNNIGQVVQSKVESGELDMEQLEQQANTLCSQLQQTQEVNQIMESNPDMLNLLNSINTSGQGGGGGLGGFDMNMMSSMFNSFTRPPN
jgi:hypothetical protein